MSAQRQNVIVSVELKDVTEDIHCVHKTKIFMVLDNVSSLHVPETNVYP
jgi:hypothetical protein